MATWADGGWHRPENLLGVEPQGISQGVTRGGLWKFGIMRTSLGPDCLAGFAVCLV